MIRAVLDANILVSALPARQGALVTLIECWRSKQFELVVSDHILAEVARAWSRPYWTQRFTPLQFERAMELLTTDATLISLVENIHGVASHPEDDPVLATAVNADVDYLVTGDKQLLALGKFRNARIVSVRDFLVILSKNSPDQ